MEDYTNNHTITMSDVGSLSIPIIRRVLSGEKFVLTHYKQPVGVVTVDRDFSPNGLDLTTLPHLRFLKRPVRDRLWAGETIGVTMVRDPHPVVWLVPLEKGL